MTDPDLHLSGEPTAHLDPRYSAPDAPSAQWHIVDETLRSTQCYLLTTSRPAGHPHTTPLIGLWHKPGPRQIPQFVFATGAEEQKAINLQHNPAVTVSIGTPRWNLGMDIVVEGEARRVTDPRMLRQLAVTFVSQYGQAWDFAAHTANPVGFSHDGHLALVFAVQPHKILVFAKAPAAQTTFRFAAQR